VSIKPLALLMRAPRLGLSMTGPPALAEPAVLAALLAQLRTLCRPLLPAQRAELRCGDEEAVGGAAALPLPARASALLVRAAPAARELASVSRTHAAQAFLLPPSVTSDGGGGYFSALGAPLAHHPRAEQLFLLHCLRSDALAASWNALLARCEAAAEGEAKGGDGLVLWPLPDDLAALAARETAAYELAGAVPAVDDEGQPLSDFPDAWATPLAAQLPPSRSLPWHAQAQRVHAWRVATHSAPRDYAALLPL
jgi:hypothetical protein